MGTYLCLGMHKQKYKLCKNFLICNAFVLVKIFFKLSSAADKRKTCEMEA